LTLFVTWLNQYLLNAVGAAVFSWDYRGFSGRFF